MTEHELPELKHRYYRRRSQQTRATPGRCPCYSCRMLRRPVAVRRRRLNTMFPRRRDNMLQSCLQHWRGEINHYEERWAHHNANIYDGLYAWERPA